MKTLPKKILVYQMDVADDEPVYSVATSADDIPEDIDGQTIGIYKLRTKRILRVRRELK
jgi:hypothetical protein